MNKKSRGLLNNLNNNKNIIIAFIAGMVISSVSVYSAANIISSRYVTYNNSTSHLEGNNVQDAIDELYAHATDYTNMDTRVTGLENYFSGTVTSVFQNNSVQVGKNASGSIQSSVNLYQNGTQRASFILATNGDALLSPRNSSGDWNTGKINILGDTIDVGKSSASVNLIGTVKANNKEINKTETVNCSLNSSAVSSGTISCRVRNGIAQVFGSNIVLKASGNSQTLATGLPKAAIQAQTNLAGSAASTTAQISAAGDVVWIQGNNTTLLMHAGSTYNLGHWFTLTYIVADS